MTEYELTFRRGGKKLNDSFSVSLTGTFFFAWWDRFQYVSFFLFLSQFFLVLSWFIFFQECNRIVKIFSTNIVLSYILFLILVLWLSLFLVSIIPFYPQSIFLYLLGFLLQFLLKEFEVFFFLLAEAPHKILSLSDFPTF